jgi:hypothetical protein
VLVKLLNETIKILRVLNLAQAKVNSVNMLVLHQNKLDYFCFQIGDAETPKSEAVKATFFLKHRRAHIEETFGVLELTALNIKFANCFALTDTPTQRLAVRLVVEDHSLESELANFLIELNSFHNLFEVLD